jgi:hypothetical protein
MQTRFIFANHLMAAVFTAAVAAHNEHIHTDDVDGCSFADPTFRTVDIDEEDGTLSMINLNDTAVVGVDVVKKVNTLAELELAIAEAIAMQPTPEGEDRNPSRVLFRTDAGGKDNPLTDFNIRIRADGTIRVGCKEFTKKGAEQVIKAANQLAKEDTCEEFETEYGDNYDLYAHGVGPRHSDGKAWLDFDGDGYATPDDVIKMGKLRARILGKLTDAQRKAQEPRKVVKVVPFQIFPSKVKAKARKKRGKR